MKFVIGVFSLALFAIVGVAGEKMKKKIEATDLNSKYEIIGPLGEPLGKLISITAKVADNPDKGFSDWLLVFSINGRKLKKPVKVHYEVFAWSKGVKKLEKEQIYSLRVYQDGGMIGIPTQAMKETTFVQTYGYHFSTKIVIISATES